MIIMNAGFLERKPSSNIYFELECSLDFSPARPIAAECDGEMFMGFENCAELGPLMSTRGLERAAFGSNSG